VFGWTTTGGGKGQGSKRGETRTQVKKTPPAKRLSEIKRNQVEKKELYKTNSSSAYFS